MHIIIYYIDMRDVTKYPTSNPFHIFQWADIYHDIVIYIYIVVPVLVFHPT